MRRLFCLAAAPRTSSLIQSVRRAASQSVRRQPTASLDPAGCYAPNNREIRRFCFGGLAQPPSSVTLWIRMLLGVVAGDRGRYSVRVNKRIFPQERKGQTRSPRQTRDPPGFEKHSTIVRPTKQRCRLH